MKTLRNHCAHVRAKAGRKLLKTVFATLCAGSLVLGGGNARAEAQFGGEFWVSTNATSMIYSGGVVYSNGVAVVGGTLDNPLDGSSQANFDQNMNNLPPGATIHILAGLYHTEGFCGGSSWIVKSGQKIIGSGIDHTILQLDGTNTSGQVWCIRSVAGTNMVVSDLTCDANGTSGVVYDEGIELTGSQCSVSRVKVIHCSSTGSEVFGIGIESSGAADNSYRNVIEDCEVSHYLGGSGITAIQLAGPLSGVVRYNHVYLPSTQYSSYFGVNMANVHDVIVEGNFVSGAECGIYCDSGGITNVLVAHNTLRDCNGGVCWGNVNTWVNDTIAFNDIEITNQSGETSAIYLEQGATGTNINIIGNVVHYLGQENPFGPNDTAPKFVHACGITGLNVANNTVQSGLTNVIGGGGYDCYNVNFFNNYDLYGNPLANGNNTIGAYPISEIGYAMLDSTNSAQVLTNLGLPGTPSIILTNTQTGVTLGGSFTGLFNGTLTGNGSALTGLNASQLTSGTVPLTQLPAGLLTNNYAGAVTVDGLLSVTNPVPNQPPDLQLEGTANSGGGVYLSSSNQTWLIANDGVGSDSNLVFRYYNGSILYTVETFTPGGAVFANSFNGTFNGTVNGNGSGLTFNGNVLTNNYVGNVNMVGRLSLTNPVPSQSPTINLNGTANEDVGVLMSSSNQTWYVSNDGVGSDSNLVFRYWNSGSWSIPFTFTPGGAAYATSFNGTFNGSGNGLTFNGNVITNNYLGNVSLVGQLSLTNPSPTQPPRVYLKGTASQDVGVMMSSSNQIWYVENDGVGTDSNLTFNFFNGSSWYAAETFTPGGAVYANSFKGGNVTVSGTLIANASFLSNNAVCPSPLGGGGWLWNSNNVLYWVTTSHTNYITGP